MTVKRVSVKTGQRWDGKIEIEHGLSANDKVVTSGQLRLNDGSAVTPVAQDTLSEPVTNTAQGS